MAWIIKGLAVAALLPARALPHPTIMKNPVGWARMPAAFGGTGFQPVRRTGKMPVPPRTFQGSDSVSILCTPGAASRSASSRSSRPGFRSARSPHRPGESCQATRCSQPPRCTTRRYREVRPRRRSGQEAFPPPGLGAAGGEGPARSSRQGLPGPAELRGHKILQVRRRRW